MMWMPLRAPKMYGRIFGFQRLVWWPKWTPASSSCRIETDGTVSDLLFGSFLRDGRVVVGDRAVDPSGTAPTGAHRV